MGSKKPPSFPPGIAQMSVSRIWRDTGFRGVLQHRVAASHLLQLLPAKRRDGILEPQGLRQEPTRQVGPNLEQAENDLIWSAPSARQGEDDREQMFYLVEVQSTVEPDMALRMINYVSLHGMQLRSDYDLPLPLIAPVVLYTGERPWDVALDSGEMFADPRYECLPSMRYYLVDLCRLEVPEESGNLIVLLAAVVRGKREPELLRGARKLQRRLVELGDKQMEHSFFKLVRAQCDNNWPDENWEDCSSMAELVDALEERTMTWPEKWRANYLAEGHAKGHAKGRAEERMQMYRTVVSSLQAAVRARFGESAAQAFAREVEVARQGDAARDLGLLDSICQCAVLSETAEQLLARLQTIRPKAE